LGDLPVLSAVAPFKAGGRGGPEHYTDVPAGRLAWRHAADLYVHPNRIVALHLTGAEVMAWLEHAAGQFQQLKPGARDAPLLNPAFPAFNFETIHGLTWRVDLSEPARFDARGTLINPAARRILDLCHDGRPIDPAARFILATNSYRSSGAGGFVGAGAGNVVLSGHETLQEVIVRHIEAGAAETAVPFVPNWRLAPVPGTTAVFRTSPRALPLLDELSVLRAQDAGPAGDGFQWVRLFL
jgi:2',3'-cyclic-nucleotide 2'-phosphodiesterase / 3'-nucleotidase